MKDDGGFHFFFFFFLMTLLAGNELQGKELARA